MVRPSMAYTFKSPELLFALLHAPKTGGSARATSLGSLRGRLVATQEHEMRLSDVPRELPVVCYLRNPIDRFESSFAVMGKNRTRDLDIDEFAEAGPPTDQGLEMVFRPQSWWLDGPDVDMRGVQYFTLDNMNSTWPALMKRYGIPAAPLPGPEDPGYNHWTRKGNRERPRLSVRGQRAVFQRYERDMGLWSRTLVNEGYGVPVMD